MNSKSIVRNPANQGDSVLKKGLPTTEEEEALQKLAQDLLQNK